MLGIGLAMVEVVGFAKIRLARGLMERRRMRKMAEGRTRRENQRDDQVRKRRERMTFSAIVEH